MYIKFDSRGCEERMKRWGRAHTQALLHAPHASCCALILTYKCTHVHIHKYIDTGPPVR